MLSMPVVRGHRIFVRVRFSPSRSTATNTPPGIVVVNIVALTFYMSTRKRTSQRTLGIGPTFHWTELLIVCVHKRKAAALSPAYGRINRRHCSRFIPFHKRYVSIRVWVDFHIRSRWIIKPRLITHLWWSLHHAAHSNLMTWKKTKIQNIGQIRANICSKSL